MSSYLFSLTGEKYLHNLNTTLAVYEMVKGMRLYSTFLHALTFTDSHTHTYQWAAAAMQGAARPTVSNFGFSTSTCGQSEQGLEQPSLHSLYNPLNQLSHNNQSKHQSKLSVSLYVELICLFCQHHM